MIKETTNQSLQKIFAGLLFVGILVLVLIKHVVPALLAGFLAYVITDKIRNAFLQRNLACSKKCNLAAGVIIVLITALIVAGISGAVAYALAGESPAEMLAKLTDTLHQARAMLPPSIAALMPDSVIAMEELVSRSFKTHASELATVGTHFAHGVVLVCVGWITGILVALRRVNPAAARHPFHETWLRMWASMSRVFEAVVFAQCKIAFINAVLTGIFLLLILPLLGYHLPFAKTLTLATFVCGLMPVIGNLVSNTLITVIALGVNFHAAFAALLFLIVVHKLEYFLNAKIQGNALGAQVWELLIVLFVMEFLFGPAGMVFAPVLYAFAKTELAHHGWLNRNARECFATHPAATPSPQPVPAPARPEEPRPPRNREHQKPRPQTRNQGAEDNRPRSTTRYLRKKPGLHKPRGDSGDNQK